MRRSILIFFLALVIVGCRGSAVHEGTPTLRQLQVGDRWLYEIALDTQRTTLAMEVVGESPAAGNGVRALTLKIDKRYWGGLPGYPKGWQETSGSYRMDQAADGSVLWGGSADGMPPVEWILVAFPPRVPSPLTPGLIVDTGIVKDDRGARRTVSRVVGPEVVPFGGRQRAWKIETVEDIWDRDDKLKLRTTTDDWYDGNAFLIRRRQRGEIPGNRLFAAADALGLSGQEIVQKSP